MLYSLFPRHLTYFFHTKGPSHFTEENKKEAQLMAIAAAEECLSGLRAAGLEQSGLFKAFDKLAVFPEVSQTCFIEGNISHNVPRCTGPICSISST